MSKILITGGAGFIGSSLADGLLVNPDHKVTIIDNLFTGKEENIPTSDRCRFIKSDVNNFYEISQVMQSTRFDYVFHYAAVVGVKRTLDNPVRVLDDIQGIKNILDLSKNTGVKRIFYASSSEVYGEPVEFPQNEHTTPLNSRLPYAVVKNIGEAYLRSYLQEYGLNYTIFRFFNTYGPKQSLDFVVSKFIKAALKNQDITIHGDGLQTRTFCFINDHIEACINAFENDQYVNDVVNIGSGNEIPILRLAQTIIDVIDSKSKLVYLPALPEGDMSRRLPDTAKMQELLGRKPIPLEEGIQKVLKSAQFQKFAYA